MDLKVPKIKGPSSSRHNQLRRTGPLCLQILTAILARAYAQLATAKADGAHLERQVGDLGRRISDMHQQAASDKEQAERDLREVRVWVWGVGMLSRV